MQRNLINRVLMTLAVMVATHGLGELPEKFEGPKGHRLIWVRAGEYAVGDLNAPRNPARRVNLKRYAIAEAETTNAQFAAFVEATGYVTDAERLGTGKVAVEGMADWEWEQVKGAHWRRPMGKLGPGWEELKDHPVTQISGADAEAYCKWLGGRLPTLEEWEVAARAGAATLYPWGKKFDVQKANIWNGQSHTKDTRLDGFTYTAPVKSFPANAWGLYDVIGNVFEYCSGFPRGRTEEENAQSVAGRGGSWWCSFKTCSSFNLVDIGQMYRHGSLSNQGFRVVLEAVPQPEEHGLKKADGVFEFHGNPSGVVEQSVVVDLRWERERCVMAVLLALQPGAEIEAEGEATLQKGEGQRLRMTFTDPFGNACVALMDFDDEVATLHIKVLKMVEARAARQYGTYRLAKRKRP